MMNKSQAQLFQEINECSFALDDIILYLDTHPTDCKALKYYCEMKEMRHALVDVYTKTYGPLLAKDVNVENEWTWVNTPWPWEGGSCGCGTMKRDYSTR